MVTLDLSIQEVTTLDTMLAAFINGLRVGIRSGSLLSPTLEATWHLDKVTITHNPKPKEDDNDEELSTQEH